MVQPDAMYPQIDGDIDFVMALQAQDEPIRGGQVRREACQAFLTCQGSAPQVELLLADRLRSEERRVGKECPV